MKSMNRTIRLLGLGAVATAIVIAATGCGGSSSPGAAKPSATSKSGAASSSQVLPVTTNPIANTSTVQALKIDSVLVENNVDPKTGKAAPDHLEISLQNVGPAPLTDFEVYYTFTERKTKSSESYYAKLPASFTIPAGAKRVVHFDDTGAADHFPVNKYSLYSTSTNALDVTVTVSAIDAAPQTTTVKKDAGGAEAAD